MGTKCLCPGLILQCLAQQPNLHQLTAAYPEWTALEKETGPGRVEHSLSLLMLGWTMLSYRPLDGALLAKCQETLSNFSPLDFGYPKPWYQQNCCGYIHNWVVAKGTVACLLPSWDPGLLIDHCQVISPDHIFKTLSLSSAGKNSKAVLLYLINAVHAVGILCLLLDAHISKWMFHIIQRQKNCHDSGQMEEKNFAGIKHWSLKRENPVPAGRENWHLGNRQS